jgi:hypothetical protein
VFFIFTLGSVGINIHSMIDDSAQAIWRRKTLISRNRWSVAQESCAGRHDHAGDPSGQRTNAGSREANLHLQFPHTISISQFRITP